LLRVRKGIGAGSTVGLLLFLEDVESAVAKAEVLHTRFALGLFGGVAGIELGIAILVDCENLLDDEQAVATEMAVTLSGPRAAGEEAGDDGGMNDHARSGVLARIRVKVWA